MAGLPDPSAMVTVSPEVEEAVTCNAVPICWLRRSPPVGNGSSVNVWLALFTVSDLTTFAAAVKLSSPA